MYAIHRVAEAVYAVQHVVNKADGKPTVEWKNLSQLEKDTFIREVERKEKELRAGRFDGDSKLEYIISNVIITTLLEIPAVIEVDVEAEAAPEPEVAPEPEGETE